VIGGMALGLAEWHCDWRNGTAIAGMALRLLEWHFDWWNGIAIDENCTFIQTSSPYRTINTLSVTKTSQLMLYREIIAVCSQIHTKHINTLCGQNVVDSSGRAV